MGTQDMMRGEGEPQKVRPSEGRKASAIGAAGPTYGPDTPFSLFFYMLVALESF